VVLSSWKTFVGKAHFNRERIPERVVHAKGAAAFGTFTVTQDITRYSKAKVFSEVGKEPVLLRFSTVEAKRSADVERGILQLSSILKKATDLTETTHRFFIRDPLKFPDFIHTLETANHQRSQRHVDYWSQPRVSTSGDDSVL